MYNTFNTSLVSPAKWDPQLLGKSIFSKPRPYCYTDNGKKNGKNKDHDLMIIDTWALGGWLCVEPSERVVQQKMWDVFLGNTPQRRTCTTPEGHPRLMLDIGANTGFYGMLAIESGCEVLFFDIQPECIAMINAGLLVNSFHTRGATVSKGISSRRSTFSMKTGGACNMKQTLKNAVESGGQSPNMMNVEVVPLRDVLPKDAEVLMMKVDTEGNEIHVLKGGEEFFQRQQIHHAIVEVSPGLWPASTSRQEAAVLFKTLASYGYHMQPLLSNMTYDTPTTVYEHLMTMTVQEDVWLYLPGKNTQ